jgi:hypothetical protein
VTAFSFSLSDGLCRKETDVITVFNGRRRTLGGGESSVWAQIDVSFRDHLGEFKGARLGVFLAIALHANEEGWAWPSYKTLQRETGYNRGAIYEALCDLCRLRINGRRVLLRYQPASDDGTFESNRYLLFPSEADVMLYDPEPSRCFRATVEGLPSRAFPNTVNSATNNNQSEQEPEEEDGMANIWRQALSFLVLRMNRETFNYLFLSSRLKAEDGHWIVEFPHESARQWAEARMADVVASALREAGGEDRPILFAARGINNGEVGERI